jgi:hypothetical protein
MNAEQTIKVFKSEFGGKYYILNGIAYDINFPLKWALTPRRVKSYAGNNYDQAVCMNCLYYGSYRGVFIGYCLECAMVFKFKRGNGMIGRLQEQQGYGLNPKHSIWNTYMKRIDPMKIGDRYENLHSIPEYKYSEYQLGVFAHSTTNCYYMSSLHPCEYPNTASYPPLYTYPTDDTPDCSNEQTDDYSYEPEDTSSFYDGDNEITDEEYRKMCIQAMLNYSHPTL